MIFWKFNWYGPACPGLKKLIIILIYDIFPSDIRERTLIFTMEMFLCGIHDPKCGAAFFVEFRKPWEEKLVKRTL